MQKGSFSLTTSLQVFYMRLTLLGLCFLYFLIVAGAQAEFPLQLNPQRAVVRYGDSVAVTCNTSVLHKGMGWEASEGRVPKTNDQNLITWRVSELKEWDIKPFCYINYKIGDEDQCLVELPVTVYKTPDSVFISTVDHRGPMTEGEQYELQCDVHNVAPVQYLTVKWYKGQTLLDQTNFTDTIETPVSETVRLLIHPDRDDDGAQYRCEAQLNLGEEGPQPHPTNSSNPLSISVHFKPIINEIKLPSVVRVFRGYPEVLVCEAEGNPKPTISWQSNGIVLSTHSEKLNITESTPVNVNCTARNSVGTDTRQVKVSIQENYIPIILGMIVAVVVVIFVIFIYKYLTYYKKNRMGHYDVKKPNARKELLAQPEQSP